MGRPDEENQDEQIAEQFHQPADHQDYYNQQQQPPPPQPSYVQSTPPPPYPPPPQPAPYQNEPQYQMPQPPPFQPFHQNPPVYQQPQAQKPPSQYQGYNQNTPQMAPSPRPAVGYPQNQLNVGTESWSTELFGCLEDPQNALITAFFPCVTFGQIAEIIDNGHSTCTTQGVLYGAALACLGMPCLVSCSYRTKLRSQYQLMETPAPDWFTHCFCEPCALCQEYRELRHRGFDPSIGWQGNLSLQQRNYAMTPPANPGMMNK
ncbi:protein PLANT CADMIUM RESISTANCE 7-like [Apium graveolens]|uniref:protein PLANT CADMIUM RESISTANCE 7-like n=1 Tax=Apium graveolens TaxID=4045 RepID=UPI003D7A9D1E